MLKRWIFLFCITACLFVLLVESSMGNRLLAGIGLLIFMQLQEISYVQDIDTARVVMRSKAVSYGAKKRPAPQPSVIPSQIDLDARRNFAAWQMGSSEDYRPPSSY